MSALLKKILIVLIFLALIGCNNTKIDSLNKKKEEKNWAYEYLEIDKLGNDYNLTGENVKVGVVDTGVSKRIDVADGINIIDNNDKYEDDHGHGSHISGILKDKNIGIAPNSELYIVKSLDENLSGNMEDIITSIDWLINKDVDIILLPFGNFIGSKELKEIIDKADSKNIFVVSSTGNFGTEEDIEVLYPARYENVIGVGALSKEEDIWHGTTTGKGLDILLPGQDIRSLSMSQGYLNASGTSMASAYLAGLIALYIEKYKDFSRFEIKENFLNDIDSMPEISNYKKFETNIIFRGEYK